MRPMLDTVASTKRVSDPTPARRRPRFLPPYGSCKTGCGVRVQSVRFFISFLPLILFGGCMPNKIPQPEPVPAKLAPVVTPSAPPAPPQTPAQVSRLITWEASGIKFEGVSFDSRNCRLVVADQPGGPGSKYDDASSAMRSRHGLAAVNAGFFTPEGTPLGLVVSSGTSSGAWNSASSLGSGAWFETSSGDMGIARREKLGRSSATGMRELIQAGPLLVENGKTVSGLEPTRTSARTFILWDGGTRWWIGRASPCTLVALGNAIVNRQSVGWKVLQGLNLDGGRSADLAISSQITGGPIVRRNLWNRPVRNFLILVPRR
jgi:hypothetical protein